MSCFSTHSPNMTLFYPRIQNDFGQFFRLADELSRLSQQTERKPSRARTFAPKFDIKEIDNAFELKGELPGIEQSDINIEWADDTTLTISGSTETHVEKSNIPAKVEAAPLSDTASETGSYKKPAVEDEDEDGVVIEKDPEQESVSSKTINNTEVTQPAESQTSNRYWLSERSAGSFQRTFNFQSRVDHAAVTASLKNGILTVIVPKAKPQAPRTVTIN